uniref:NP n=1 Tax=Tiliqua thogotovirus TaxID=2992311 RepID=A0A9E7V606_9ORTO|nr:NP [Tiliqua thogotovirus]
METDKQDPPGQNSEVVQEMYQAFKAQMEDLAKSKPTGKKAAATKIDLKIDHNAELIGSIVMAVLTENKELREVDSYNFFVETEVPGVYEQRPVEINISVLRQWAKVNVHTKEAKGRWYPFLALLQISNKTKDSILWQKYPVSQELGLSPALEIYAHGYNIKDKLKNSRPRSVGPLAHVLHLKRLQDGPKNNRSKKTLSHPALTGIRKSLIGHLKRQCIGETQRAMINMIERDQWEILPTFAASLLAIKPRIENHFVLTYPFIANVESFKGATMSDEWVYKTMRETCAKTRILVCGPDMSWHTFLCQIQIHCVFQSTGEDLGVLDWMFGSRFLKRKEFGKYCKKSQLQVLLPLEFDYVYWSKPLKAAPRTVEGAKRSQISCRPSFKGQRASYNNFQKLEDICSTSTDSGKTLYEQVQEECQKYLDVKVEGTTCFYKKGGMEPVFCDAANNTYLFG